jgi:tRNA dimethylallyltransferase
MKENLFILMGPTAVGKTSISIEMAKRLNGEIISADSMQIYKYMDIGTAKITKDEMQNIPHYMIDILYPDEAFTVANYKQLAAQHISKINSEGKLPLVVGGTGLYINSLVYKLNFASVPPNEEYRRELEKLADRYGNEYIYDMLLKIDIESGSRISIKDRKRIIRALEIYESTGKTMSEYNKDFRMENDDYNLSMVCLNMSRDKLYSRINQRVDIMIEQGLVEEVRRILSMGYDRSLISLKGIGYKEIIMYLNNECTLEEAIDKIKQGSRNYAKRQLTWFRRDNRIKWIDVDDFQNMKELCDNIENYIIGNHTI